MCLIVFSYKQHPHYDFIFAANRDEFYGRPTRAARFWDEEPDILAGKDMEGGGTWMGISKNGYFSALTNYRDPKIEKENPPSRGHLVLDYLKKDGGAISYLQEVKEKADRYMGFNLLTGTMDKLAYYSNMQSDIEILEAGIYGLSNHLLDTEWPKVRWAKNHLKKITKEKEFSEEELFELLLNNQKASEKELPDTGIPKAVEKQVSSIFIEGDEYGTRSSTVLLIDKKGQVTFSERRYEAGTRNVKNSNRYQFAISD